MTAPTPSPTRPDLAAAFEAEATRLFEEYCVPGVTLALLTPDGDHFVNLGVTHVEHPLPVTSETLFQIGSTTKTITSLTCSVLAAQGRLDLDVPLRTYLPEFALKDDSVAAALTVHDVLTHQGGFQGDLFEETGDGDDAVAKVLVKLAEAPQVVPRRGHWSYNNAGFYVAGRVIEVVTGQTFEAAVTELVFGPLGMDHTLFFPSMIMTHRFATGHNKVDGEMVVQRPWIMMRSAAPAGSTCSSTAADMARYARYIMSGQLPAGADGEGAPAPTVATLDRAHLWAPVRSIGVGLNAFPGQDGQIGQSWFVDAHPGATIISHGGTTHGQQSDFWVSPDRGVGFIAMTNASNGHAMNRRLGEWVKRELLGLTRPERQEITLDGSTLERYAGTYDVIGQDFDLVIRRDGEHLTLVLPTPATGGSENLAVRFIAPQRAVVVGGDADGLGVEFLTTGAGDVEFIRFGARLYPRVTDGRAGLPLDAP